MDKYLSFNYWFNVRPDLLSSFGMNIIFYISTILIIIGVAGISGVLKKILISQKKIDRVVTFCFTNTIIGLGFAFFNYQIIPYFRSRFLYIIWFIIAVIWLWKIIFPPKKDQHILSQREKEIKKYLPN